MLTPGEGTLSVGDPAGLRRSILLNSFLFCQLMVLAQCVQRKH